MCILPSRSCTVNSTGAEKEADAHAFALPYTAAEIAALHPFVQFYRDHGALLRSGSYYRLAAPGLPLPALRGEVPGHIAWLHTQG